MKKISGFNFLLVIIAMTLPLVTDTAGLAAKSAEERELYEIRIPDTYDPTGVYTPYLADELGYFKEAGIKPIFTGVIPPGQHVAAVTAGTNDVGGMHINRTIVGIAGGAKIKCVVAQSETTADFPHMEFIVLEKSGIKEPQDLFGKKVGVTSVGGCHEFTPYEWLRKYTGVNDPRGKFEFVLVPTGNEETALRTGEVDVVGFHGHPIDIFERGGVRVLFDDYVVWGSVGGATPFFCREDFIKRNPEAVRRFVAAMTKTGNWLNNHQEEAKLVYAKRMGLNPNQITLMYEAPDGIIEPESVQMWMDLTLKYGEIKKAIPLDQVYTNEFNEYAKGN
ncbi:MAG: ABC transporter substrate-binding protein [Synergistaceae bacterium]|nr:ABC transporter substrate-binding protein [Synergistaceae bacterium]